MLIFGFAQVAQFSITAGNTSALRPADIAFLHQRAIDITKLTRAVSHVISSAFRLGTGEVLMLGIPVAEPEHTSDRRGLCVVFTVFVSRKQVASPGMLVQMLASLELAVGQSCHSSYTNPIMTATAYTQLLQRRNDDLTLESISNTTEELSLLFTSMLKSKAQRRRKLILPHPIDPKGSTVNNSLSFTHYATAFQAASRLGTSRTGELCYYLPFNSELVTSRFSGAAVDTHLFLDRGIIVGHSFPKSVDSYL
jgi:hypothetical protein